jgi:hypothetical protein
MTSSKTRQDLIAAAREMGRRDGGQMAAEAVEDGTYSGQGAGDFDAGLINAVGGAEAARLFGCEPDGETFRACCAAYNEGAEEAWEAAVE